MKRATNEALPCSPPDYEMMLSSTSNELSEATAVNNEEQKKNERASHETLHPFPPDYEMAVSGTSNELSDGDRYQKKLLI